MSDFGLLPRYQKADLHKIHTSSPEDLIGICKKILTKSRARFYSDGFNIYLYGNYRVGKTWTLHAIANHITKVYGDKSVYYIKSPALYKYYRDNTMWRNDYTWIEFLKSRRVLLLDDLGQEYRKKGSGFAETMFEEFLRWRFDHNKITYIGSNADFDSLEEMYGQSLRNFIENEYVSYNIDSDINMSKVIKKEKLKLLLRYDKATS